MKRLLQIVFTLILVFIVSCNWNPFDPENNDDDTDTTETSNDTDTTETQDDQTEQGNYFPLQVGNKWIFDATKIYCDDFFNSRVIGQETWEIIDINETRDTIIMDFSLIGRAYTHWYSSDTTVDNGEVLSASRHRITSNHSVFKNHWWFCGSLSDSVFSSYICYPLGNYFFMNYGIPHSIESTEDTVNISSLGSKMIRNIGPLELIFPSVDCDHTLKLNSYTINGVSIEIEL